MLEITKEDSSDYFFQSKHINRRKEEFEKQLELKMRKVHSKLENGLSKIINAYNNRDWINDEEKLFLELFSELHVDDTFHGITIYYGYYLLSDNDVKACFYDLENDIFVESYGSIWSIFMIQFNVNYNDIQLFMKEMLKKYFKLYDATALSIPFLNY